MELDRLEAVLRPRSSWEAIDLGFAMARRWARPVYRAWLVTVLPAYAAVWAALFAHPLAAVLVVWWLKPLWDQVPLFVTSRALFGEVPTVGRVLRELPRLWARQLLLGLLLYRFDPARSFFQPVLQLERPRGSARGRRRRALGRTTGPATAFLLLVSVALELLVLAGLAVFLVILLPSGPQYELTVLAGAWWEGGAPLWFRIAVPCIAFAALSVVEPLYVTAGFALYINRRTQLEGWDVELGLRRMADRLRGRGPSAAGAGAATAALILALLGGTAGLARAEVGPVAPAGAEPSEAVLTPGPDAPAGGRADQAVRRVLSREEFGRREVRHGFRRRAPAEQERAGAPPELLRGLGSCLAVGLEVIIWATFAVILVAIALVVISRLRRREGGEPARGSPAAPGARTGLSTVPPGALPADVVAAAAELWRQGLRTQALGLLYGGAVSALSTEGGLPIEDGATEGECLRVVRAKAAPATAAFFARLAATWQAVAYGHREPDEEAFGALSSEWPAHFGGRP